MICTHCRQHPGRHPLLTADTVEYLCFYCLVQFVAAVEAAGTCLTLSVQPAPVPA